MAKESMARDEVISMDSIYAEERRMAKQRMAAIVGMPEEQGLAVWGPNDARGCNENPLVYKTDED